MRLLRWVSRNIRKYRIWNEEIMYWGLTLIDENMSKSGLRWFGYVYRRAN